MKYITKVLLAIFDPISTFTTKTFPEKAYKLCNKGIWMQLIIALIITTIFILIVRLT